MSPRDDAAAIDSIIVGDVSSDVLRDVPRDVPIDVPLDIPRGNCPAFNQNPEPVGFDPQVTGPTPMNATVTATGSNGLALRFGERTMRFNWVGAPLPFRAGDGVVIQRDGQWDSVAGMRGRAWTYRERNFVMGGPPLSPDGTLQLSYGEQCQFFEGGGCGQPARPSTLFSVLATGRDGVTSVVTVGLTAGALGYSVTNVMSVQEPGYAGMGTGGPMCIIEAHWFSAITVLARP